MTDSSENAKPMPAEQSMFDFRGAALGRRRGQRPSKKNPYKKGPSWIVRWREDVCSSGGAVKRVLFNKRLAPAKGPDALTKREADRQAWEQIFSKLDAIHPQSLATVNQFIEARFQPNIVSKTRSPHYRNTLPHIEKALGALRLRDVRADHVYELIHEMERKGYSTQTIKHVVSALRRLFRHAKELHYFTGDVPTQFVALGAVRHKERGALSAEQVYAIADSLDPPYRQLVLLLACTGLRIGEAVGLRWQRLNLMGEAQVIEGQVLPPWSVMIAEAWVRNRWSELKTVGSAGVLPVARALAEELAAWRALSRWTAPEDPVFSVRSGRPIEPSNAARKKLKPALAKLGLSREISWHWFRHTLASLADEAGMSEAQRQEILRHADPAMTRHYTHARLEPLRAGLEIVAGRIIPAKKGPGRERGDSQHGLRLVERTETG